MNDSLAGPRTHTEAVPFGRRLAGERTRQSVGQGLGQGLGGRCAGQCAGQCTGQCTGRRDPMRDRAPTCAPARAFRSARTVARAMARDGVSGSARAVLGAGVLVAVIGGCSPTVVASGQREATAGERLAHLEGRYADVRDLERQVEIGEGLGGGRSPRGLPLDEVRRTAAVARVWLLDTLRRVDTLPLGAEDRRAWRAMVAHLESSEAVAVATAASPTAGAGGAEGGSGSACAGPPGGEVAPLATDTTGGGSVAARGEAARRAAALSACFARVAHALPHGNDTLDRLTILGRLAREPDAGARHRLFLALAPLWRTVNGDNTPASPYRALVRASAAAWRAYGSPVDAAARALGMDPHTVVPALEQVLAAWRATAVGDTLLEPWDWYYAAGEASRRLSPRVPLARLREVNDRFFRDHGADPLLLRVHYDLAPRAGKTPVAFTQLGVTPRAAGDRWRGGEAWVVASYSEGGFDALVELLHETGHAVHVAAIRARPAFADWPDADPLTEALGDLWALEAYAPAWQARYLGDSVPAAVGRRAAHAALVLDVAWALFEIRLHEDPAQDPNTLWTAITQHSLGIAPHPEWSWWALRGQLVGAPGYMANYALGGMAAAALRERVAARVPLAQPDRGTYRWLSAALYRFGASRPSREVVAEFLGGPVTPGPLLAALRAPAGR